MHSRLGRLLALFAIMICLPLQGLAAVTMPACQSHGMAMEMQAVMVQAAPMDHCSLHDKGQPSKHATSDKCSYCALNVAQAIIPFALPVALKGSTSLVAGLITDIPDSLPSSLFRPPRSILA